MYSPRFTITNKILKSIGAIEASKEVVDNAPIIPYYEKKFKDEATLRTIHHGTHIEGNDLTISQTKQILEGQEISARERDIQEIINYRNATSLLDEFAVKRGGYEVSMILDIYKETVNKIVPDEKLGIRKSQVVVREEGTGKIVFQPPPAIRVEYLLNDFVEWLNSSSVKDIHPVLVAGIVHYVLVAIHSFVEGNGRTSRAFATLVLMREGYDIKRLFSLEEHFDKDLRGYYEALSVVDQSAQEINERDLTPWLEFFTSAVATEFTKVKDQIRKLSIDSKLKLKMGQQIALSERQIKLVEYLSEFTSAGMKELRSLLPMVSEDTILRDIKDLLDNSIIKKKGSTKAAKYFLANP